MSRTRFRAALDAVHHGEPGDALALVKEEPSPDGTLWLVALRSVLRCAGIRDLPGAGAETWVDPGVADAEGAGEAAHALARELSLGAAGQLDQRARAWIETSAAHASSGDARAALCARLARLWLDVFAGGAETPLEEASELGRTAAKLGHAVGAVEAAALRALLLHRSEHPSDEAVVVARRASRMARTESLPQAEYLAGLVLARFRRCGGRPHHALRILSALARVAPPHFRPWLAWELAMAGAVAGGAEPLAAFEHPAASSLGDLLSAARAGDRERFDVALHALHASSRLLPWMALDAAGASVALDPDCPPEAWPADIASWRRGTVVEPPQGLDGLVVGADDSPGVIAHVWCPLGAAASRVLAPGINLVHPAAHLGGTRGRVATALPVLALGGWAMEETVLFHAVYRFPYEPELHYGTLNMLVHRLREAVAEVGALERRGSVLTLSLERSVAFPDPRCAVLLEDRVLRLVARREAASAREMAERLGVPLRSAQAALESLVKGGECRRERHGRSVDYIVEDTTFLEPTRS